MKDYGPAGLGDETGPLEMMDLSKKKTTPKDVRPKKKAMPAPMQKKKTKMRTIPIDGGSVELPEDEPYGLERPMKKGGKVKKYAVGGNVAMEKIADKAVKGHEKRMHKMARGGSVSRGDGICKKGHTKGKMV